jgi:hypothetical protein
MSALDFCNFTIQPCFLRILSPNMRSNYDVYRGSLDTSSKTENIISIISNTLLVNQRVENEPTKKTHDREAYHIEKLVYTIIKCFSELE